MVRKNDVFFLEGFPKGTVWPPSDIAHMLSKMRLFVFLFFFNSLCYYCVCICMWAMPVEACMLKLKCGCQKATLWARLSVFSPV